MGRRNLLLCFDAFGTLFKPRRPIAEQYAAVARQCGLEGFSVEQVRASFKAAFTRESVAHPNYGKANGMGPEMWWTNVIRGTFQPLVGPGTALPKDLAPRLLHRFSSNEGYALAPGIDSLLRSAKRRRGDSRVVVGVITNSDDRVPGILSSFGLHVSPLRFGSSISQPEANGRQFDVDLHCMSYDVGFEKPDRRIFDAAEGMADGLLAAQDGLSGIKERAPWLKLYVGDEFEKDVVGACAAGWNAVFVGPEKDVPGHENVLDLDRMGDTPPEDVFPLDNPSPSSVRAPSPQALLKWLIKHQD